jgi:hypothetical protein
MGLGTVRDPTVERVVGEPERDGSLSDIDRRVGRGGMSGGRGTTAVRRGGRVAPHACPAQSPDAPRCRQTPVGAAAADDGGGVRG